MKATDLMTAPPVTVDLTTTVLEAARRMEREAVGCVLVTDDGRLRGILTDRDLTLRGLAHGYDPGRPVAGLMTAPVVTVDAHADLDTAYRTFRTADVRRLPVLDDGRPVGMLTIDDLLRDVVQRLFDLLVPVSYSALRSAAVRPHRTGPVGPVAEARTPDDGKSTTRPEGDRPGR